MPDCIIHVQGKIQDFDRVDNAFKAIKTQTEKLLKDWTILVTVAYEEKQESGR